MILTSCAACAAPLAHTAPRCVRCHTRYCNATCQHDHWRRGHKQICKRIHRGGNAEQYYADKKYKEAVAVAVEACAEDTKGQKCYICTQALHWKTKEGLVRGCACRGTSGFAHVSCLAEQAKILMDEAEENNLDDKVKFDRFDRWYNCSLCKQHYHGVVQCALGWGCWKAYVGRPEVDPARKMAMTQLGNGLFSAKHYEDALSVEEAELSTMRRLGAPEGEVLVVQANLANSYRMLGRYESALRIKREVYARKSALCGSLHESTLISAVNLASSLVDDLQQFDEAKVFLRDRVPEAVRSLGKDHYITFRLQRIHAQCLFQKNNVSGRDLKQAVATLEDLDRRCTRIYGAAHPQTYCTRICLERARAKLALAEKMYLECKQNY